ncbi:hypothetical protein MA16_Dca028275 [Dendrobium catenatum]|uniref:DUF4283 domain-containing protein n=1 Tax=Dendrobium catenatum TaxID=906689 RepID=A0A2I0VCI5_9ASPA|nr:hypothetical protein MA16_Dca028275 [Dendrobium catenatum]
MAIVAKLMARRISFPFLLEELKQRWFHFGEFKIITIGPNTFICIFQSLAARDAVLSSGPWIIAGNIIGMDKWDSTCSPNSLHGLRSPIWICLPQLPLIYWDINNITRIANLLGEPLWMDSHTSKWGRSSFARICVRIDLSQKLLLGVWINGIHGKFFQWVEYEGLTNFCFDYGFIGHAKGSYLPITSSKGPTPTQVQASQPAQAQHGGLHMTGPPHPRQQSMPVPHGQGVHEDDSFGTWNLVTHKKRNKQKAPTEQPAIGQKKGVEPPQSQTQPPLAELQRMEEISKRIIDPSGKASTEQRVTFSVTRSENVAPSLTVNLSKRQDKAPKTFLEKQLLQLGPIATLPRKRRKNLQDDTGGDFVPFEEQ